jgi:uncharacterized protein (DUF58 family)
MARGTLELPSPGVRFAPDFLARVGRLIDRLASQRERREGDGRARLFGVGSEFVGYRPYRSGEDLRALDWNLLARLGRPFVRVAAREASEHWVVWLDTSASMGVGVPGKLQLGAELATALAALGLARRARVELWLSGGARPLALEKRVGLAPWMRALEGARASGRSGLAALLARAPDLGGAGRVFLIGDLLDLEPPAAAALARPSRELFLAQILAREELVPAPEGAVRWVDAEGGGARELWVDDAAAKGYERRLGARLERWRRTAGCVRAAWGCWTSDTPFETLVRELCTRAG